MGYIVLELVRDKNGQVTNVVSVNTQVRRVESGYVQIVKGEIVAHFVEDEIVIAEIHDTSL
jgi:hypothetical protein